MEVDRGPVMVPVGGGLLRWSRMGILVGRARQELGREATVPLHAAVAKTLTSHRRQREVR